MNRYNKLAYCVFYVIVIVCSLNVLYKNINGLFQVGTGAQIYDENQDAGKSSNKKLPLTTVETSPIHYRVGDITKGTFIEHSFHIKNTGKDSLVIYDVIPDCICTDCSLSQKVVKPGEQTDINVTVDTNDKKGMFIVNVIICANSQEGAHRFMISGCVV